MKSFAKSKTIIANAIAAAGGLAAGIDPTLVSAVASIATSGSDGVVTVPTDFTSTAGFIMFGWGVLNVILRAVTKQQVTIRLKS